MARSWLVWLSRIVAVAALLWAVWWLCSLLSPQWDARTVIAIAIVALAILWGIWWLWWRLPRRQVTRLSIQIPDPKARADAEDNFRKTVGQALGGAAVLIGAGAAYLQFSQQQQTASDQIAAQQQAAEVSRKVSQDLLISNQVAKVEQLASKEMSMRLGGTTSQIARHPGTTKNAVIGILDRRQP
jgi:hypothetical protein